MADVEDAGTEADAVVDGLASSTTLGSFEDWAGHSRGPEVAVLGAVGGFIREKNLSAPTLLPSSADVLSVSEMKRLVSPPNVT